MHGSRKSNAPPAKAGIAVAIRVATTVVPVRSRRAMMTISCGKGGRRGGKPPRRGSEIDAEQLAQLATRATQESVPIDVAQADAGGGAQDLGELTTLALGT